MKKTLLLFLLCLSSLTMYAQNLVVNTKDNSQTKIPLASKPTVSLGLYGEKIKITYKGKTKELDMKDLKFEGVGEGSSLRAIVTIDGTQLFIPLAAIQSITTSDYNEDANHLARVIANNPDVTLYAQALKLTGLADSLTHVADATYSVSPDSTKWNNPSLVIHIAVEYENVAYIPVRYYKYTAFLVTDATLKEKYGVNNINDLRDLAHQIYDPVYPADAAISDETDRRNALNRFISYHLLPFKGEYYKLTSVDGESSLLANQFNREIQDITDWYETMMPHSIMKFSFPSGSEEGLYINRRGVQSNPDALGIKIPGVKVSAPGELTASQEALNGIFYYVDGIVAYDKEMQMVVCNDRIRIDATTLSPDFMTSGARGHATRNGMYGRASTIHDIDNPNTCLGFKPGSAANFKFDNSTHLHVRPRCLDFWSYQGDEVAIIGDYDVEVKLPPLPAGKYELRVATCVQFESRGIVRFYIDGKIVTDSVDFRVSGSLPNSPYSIFSTNEYDPTHNRRFTRYTLKRGPGYISDSELMYYDRRYVNEEGTGYQEQLYDDFIYILRRDDINSYKNALKSQQLAMDYPESYIFEGEIPADPSSEEMNSYYENLVNKQRLLQIGACRYNDYMMREGGWMKGPASYCPGSAGFYGSGCRDCQPMLRRVVGTLTTDGQSDHYLRMVQLLKDMETVHDLTFDYIELVPVSLIEDEDIY